MFFGTEGERSFETLEGHKAVLVCPIVDEPKKPDGLRIDWIRRHSSGSSSIDDDRDGSGDEKTAKNGSVIEGN